MGHRYGRSHADRQGSERASILLSHSISLIRSCFMFSSLFLLHVFESVLVSAGTYLCSSVHMCCCLRVFMFEDRVHIQGQVPLVEMAIHMHLAGP